MHCLQSFSGLDENLPNLSLFNIGLDFLVVTYFLKYITVIGQLHDDAQALGLIIDKCLFVLNNIGVSN